MKFHYAWPSFFLCFEIASLRKVFDRYDDNGNGLIDQDEFMKVWEDEFDTEHRIPEEAIMETLRSLDTNGDMVIDFAEFVEATNRLKEKVKNQQKEKEKTVDEEIEYTVRTARRASKLFSEEELVFDSF